MKEGIKIKENYLIKVNSIYKEYDEGHPKNYTFCNIKVQEKGIVTLTKNTAHQTRIILEKGVRHYSPYYTEYGLLTMTVFTHDINNNLGKDGGTLNLKYAINVNTNLLGLTDITIEVNKLKS